MTFAFRMPRVLFVLWLVCVLIPTMHADADTPAPLGIVNVSGFCPNGAWSGVTWPGGTRPGGLQIWGSFCEKADDNVGRAESQDFIAPSLLHLYLSGYPGLPGRRLFLKNKENGQELDLNPQSQAGSEWRYTALPVATEWIGKRVQLIAEDTATGPFGWLAFSMPVVAPSTQLVSSHIDTHAPQSGFCPDGAFGSTKWPEGGRPPGIQTWGSYCTIGDAATGWMAAPPFKAPSNIKLYFAGYPDTPGLSVALENLQTGEQFPLRVATAPHEFWELHYFRLPSNWQGQSIRVIARDQAAGFDGWFAFSEPVPLTLTDQLVIAGKTCGLIFLLTIVFLIPPVVVCMFAEPRTEKRLYRAAAALVALGLAFAVFFFSPFRSLEDGVAGYAVVLAAATIIAWFYFSPQRGLLELLIPAAGDTPAEEQKAMPRWLVLTLVWGGSAVAILPALFHWAAPPPYTGTDRFVPFGFVYLVALGICYWIFRIESRQLSLARTLILVFLVFLLTAVVNNIHSLMVDKAANYFVNGTPNRWWQNEMQEKIIQLSPSLLDVPHSYRFLPNSIVRWLQLARLDYDSARDLFRLLANLLLFYSIYKYARLYCNYTGALIAMLLIAAIYPISFEHYAGQLTDPLSHLSFVLAFIFLETEEFALLLTTLLIGSLAKETVLALAGYYVLFCRKEKGYLWKAAVLCVTSAAVYFGVRSFILHGAMHYQQASGVTLQHVQENWEGHLWNKWIVSFLLTACALMPFLAIAWKETPLSLKRLTVFLFPVLFLSSLFFSWLSEGRNYMPMVFVLAVVAGRYLSRRSPARVATQDQGSLKAVTQGI